MDTERTPKEKKGEGDRSEDQALEELLPLLRILLQDPPPDHDFATCQICRRWGITRL